MRAADRFEAARAATLASTREMAAAVDPAITRNFRSLIVQRIENITGPRPETTTRAAPRPVLEELDRIALIAAEHGDNIELEKISLTNFAVTVVFTANNTRTAERAEATA